MDEIINAYYSPYEVRGNHESPLSRGLTFGSFLTHAALGASHDSEVWINDLINRLSGPSPVRKILLTKNQEESAEDYEICYEL